MYREWGCENKLDNKIELSICISSYNNREWIYELVTKILICKDNRFDVIISDNASTDGSYEKLLSIKDNRLRLFQNETNIGPTANYMNTIWRADGKYILFMIDKDLIIAENIPRFIDMIAKKELSVGYCAYGYHGLGNIEILPKGKYALSGLSYLMMHPTGYIYNREKLRYVRSIEWYSNIDNVGFFPFEFLNADLATIGDGIRVNTALLYPRKVNKSDKIQKSLTYSRKSNNLFFEPQKRLEMMKKCFKHLYTIKIERNIKNELTKSIFYNLCKQATFSYKDIMMDPIKCEHYGLEIRNIRFIKLLYITGEFSKLFIKTSELPTLDKVFAVLHIFLYSFNEMWGKLFAAKKNNLNKKMNR